MSLTLYWLDGRDGHRFSPYAWRSRMALAHKGLDAELVAVKFTEKDRIAFSGQDRVPVLTDGDETVADSWAIACYLEDAYPDMPTLFGAGIGRGEARFINHWADSNVIMKGIAPLVVKDILDHVQPEDRDYFRRSREARFGDRLEEVQRGREERLGPFRDSLGPLRATLAAQPFVCGEAPAYADYIFFGCFMWARCVSSFKLLADDDPIHGWRERMLDLFDGLGRKAVGYPC